MTNKPMLSVELMPCPMCLGKVRDPVAKHIGHGDFCFLVSCNCGLSFDGGQDLESAIRTWNRRAKPAAQHQGEPIKLSDDVREFLQEWLDSSTGGEDEDIDYDFANQLGLLLGPIYAEPPAPVAPPPINYGALDPVERLAVCRGEVAPVAVPNLEMSHVVRAHMDIPGCPVLTSNQCHTLAMKLNACLDELKLLNPSL